VLLLLLLDHNLVVVPQDDLFPFFILNYRFDALVVVSRLAQQMQFHTFVIFQSYSVDVRIVVKRYSLFLSFGFYFYSSSSLSCVISHF
jgi:hypothetical protein